MNYLFTNMGIRPVALLGVMRLRLRPGPGLVVILTLTLTLTNNGLPAVIGGVGGVV